MTHKKNRKFHIVSIILSVILIIGIFPLAVSAAGCENCGEESGYTVAYEYWTSTYHSVRHWCNSCGKDQTMGGAAEAHSYSHSSSGYDVCVCGHSVACSCGGEGGEISCNHRNIYTYWEGCEWYTQCSSCDVYMGSGIEHDEYEHIKVYECWCGHRYDEYELHNDTNGDGKCDMCGFANKRFSVTVPAFLTLTVSEDGTVYAATTAMIFNNSTGEIAVTDISLFSEGGWTIVPFCTNMANEKVNTKLIGFRINESESTSIGYYEDLTLNGGWNIAADSILPLDYAAVVSALSEPIDEQVLTVAFIVGWA